MSKGIANIMIIQKMTLSNNRLINLFLVVYRKISMVVTIFTDVQVIIAEVRNKVPNVNISWILTFIQNRGVLLILSNKEYLF